MHKLDPNSFDFAGQTLQGLDHAADSIEHVTFSDCTFRGCDFQEARFTSCQFIDCALEGCNLSLMKITDCSLRDVRFNDCQLMGVDWTLARWDKNGILNSVGFTNCVVNYGIFFGLTLRKLIMEDCIARGVDFTAADLTGASLTGTDFADARFRETNLTEADLRQAKNYAIDVNINTITQAQFSFPEAISLLYSMDIVLEEQ